MQETMQLKGQALFVILQALIVLGMHLLRLPRAWCTAEELDIFSEIAWTNQSLRASIRGSLSHLKSKR